MQVTVSAFVEGTGLLQELNGAQSYQRSYDYSDEQIPVSIDSREVTFGIRLAY